MANCLSQCLNAGHRDEQGASLVEYILLAILIGVAVIASLTFMGRAAGNQMNNIAAGVQNQPS